MLSLKNISVPKILLFLPFLLIALFVFFQAKKSRLAGKRAALSQQVGRQFPDFPMLDINGNNAKPDLTQSRKTIIDFWFRNCPQCIVEMHQFEEALKGKEKDISIVSVSIDDEASWKKVMEGKVPAFNFIHPVKNWQHLLLNYSDSAGDKSTNQQLADQLGVTGYPSYFVLNQQGKIEAVPASAVNFIKTDLNKQNEFLVFLTSRSTWRSTQTWLLLLLSLFVYQVFINIIIKKKIRQ